MISHPVIAPLQTLQHWLLTIVSHPEGPERGWRIAQAQLGLSEQDLGEIVCADYGIAPQQRLAIYNHGYFARLLQCLRGEYPVLTQVLSPRGFDPLARRYIAQYPPRSSNLNDLGKHFPDFLAADRPDKCDREKTPLFDFIHALARVERAKVEIARGVGIEHIDFSQFDDLEQRAVDTLHITLAPSVRLIEAPFKLCEYLGQQPALERSGFPAAAVEFIALTRLNFSVVVWELAHWQYLFLKHLQECGSAERATQQIGRQFGPMYVQSRLPVWLASCAEKGLFSAIRAAGATDSSQAAAGSEQRIALCSNGNDAENARF